MAPHSTTIRRSLKRLQLVHHAHLVDRLQDVESLSLTLDFWSNRHSKSFFVVTGHFISSNFELSSTVLDFSHFSEEHSADKIANTLSSKLNRLNVLSRVVAVTCDGARNLKKALPSVGVIDRVWCLGHRLHLIIVNGLGLWLTEKVHKRQNEKESGRGVAVITTALETKANGSSHDEDDNDEDQLVDVSDGVEICDDSMDQVSGDNTDQEDDDFVSVLLMIDSHTYS